MSADLQVQVLDDIVSLASAKRFRACHGQANHAKASKLTPPLCHAEHAAFIRSTQSLAMWTDNVRELLAQIESMQDAMMDYIYSGPATAGASEKLAEKADVVQSIRPSWHQAPLMGGLSTGLNIFLACATIRASSYRLYPSTAPSLTCCFLFLVLQARSSSSISPTARPCAFSSSSACPSSLPSATSSW
jgi:hypothetical protein